MIVGVQFSPTKSSRRVICICSNFTSTLFSGGVPQNVSQWDLVSGEHQQDLQGRHLQQLLCQLPDLGLPRSGRFLRPYLRLWDDLQRNWGFDIRHRCSGEEMKRKWNTYLLFGKKNTCHVSNILTKNFLHFLFSVCWLDTYINTIWQHSQPFYVYFPFHQSETPQIMKINYFSAHCFCQEQNELSDEQPEQPG